MKEGRILLGVVVVRGESFCIFMGLLILGDEMEAEVVGAEFLLMV